MAKFTKKLTRPLTRKLCRALFGVSDGTAPLAAPVNLAVPVISGTAQENQTLTSSTGVFSGNPSPTYTYQWRRDGVNIGGATASSYLVIALDVGTVLSVVVTATNSQGNASGTSANTATVTAAPVGGTSFDPYYNPLFTLRSDTTFSAIPSISRPASKASSYAVDSYDDPNFGTRVYRATDIADVTNGSGVTFMRHEYSRKQAFNSDGTKFIARGSGGFWYLYDALTFARIPGGRTSTTGKDAIGGATTQQFGADCEAMWHPTDPNKLWRTDTNGSLTWYEFDINTHVTTTLFDLTSLCSAAGMTGAARAWFQAEGKCSTDGRYWGFSIQDSGFNQVAIACYDRQAHAFLGYILTTNKPNNVSITPDGMYVIPSWSNAGSMTMAAAAAANINSTNGARAYNRAMTTFQQLSYYGEHSDVAIDAAGNAVLISVNYNAANMPDVIDGQVYYRRCDNGVAYNTPINVYSTVGHSVHMSGCAARDKPGWALVGLFGGAGNTYDGEMLAVELVPSSARVLRLGHHHSADNDYWAEPHGTVNHDFTKVLFASDWGTTTNFESCMIGLPSWAIPTAGVITPTAPVNTVLPVVTGSFVLGDAATSDTGTWTGYPTPTYAYQWQENVSSVWTNRGTNSNTFTPANVGDFRVIVTATNSQGSASATSSSFTVAAAGVGPTLRVSTKATAASANSVTSSGITTVSGDTLGVFVVWQGTDPMPTVTDSMGNTYTQYGASAGATNSGFTYRIGIALCNGSVSVGGAGHTFTATKTSSYPTIFPFAVTGANATSPVDGYAAAQDTATPYTSGDVTPTGNSRLILSGISTFDTTAYSVAGPYSVIQSYILSQVTYWTGALASYSQSTAAATSASWTLTPNIQAALATIAFKA